MQCHARGFVRGERSGQEGKGDKKVGNVLENVKITSQSKAFV